MGVAQSSYTNLEHRPFVDGKLHVWESGTEVRSLIDTVIRGSWLKSINRIAVRPLLGYNVVRRSLSR
jgi:hypothetical protein